jgi:CubicO group peptidase (beta-lactamase class C family)
MPPRDVGALAAHRTKPQISQMRKPFFALIAIIPSVAVAQEPSLAARVDKIFARFDRNAPGCAVGLAKDSHTLLTQGYGSANLEYRIPLTDSSVMESGSVAKQFTAAALVLLEQDGKLSIDDDIRKYLPEVPNFGAPITIRNILTHTSGLRDQWGLLGIEGRGPGSQVHSPATTLDLVVHQKMLNFPPGSEYLYSNTGYALAGIIAQRVSGKSLNDFLQERLFQPLGMTHTQLRDDFTRVVPNRATAYAPVNGGWRQDMPFTNMIGNGGVLSTMADLMIWNENLDHPRIGGPRFTDAMQTRMRLTNGKTITYALGLEVVDYDGVHEVGHSGSTAGYRTFLARYPDQHVSVAVWCSNASANPTQLAHQMADLVLTKPQRAAQAGAPLQLVSAQWAGLYVNPRTDQMLRVSGRDSLRGVSFSRNAGKRRLTLVRPNADTTVFEEAQPPSDGRMGDYVGRYTSDELDVVITIVSRAGKLYLQRRPADEFELRPAYTDDFQAGGGLGTLRFRRDRSRNVTGFSFYAGRVLDVRFTRVPQR